MRMRPAFLALSMLASALIMAMAPAGASFASPSGRAMPAGSPGQASLAQAPAVRASVPGLPVAGRAPNAVSRAGRIIDDVFTGDSCASWPDSPSITSFCVTAGTWAAPGEVNGLLEASRNGTPWYIANTFGYGSVGPVTAPFELSCVPQQYSYPTCVAVGEHYKDYRFPAQLVETGTVNGFGAISTGNPKGATWSVLDDVSCASATFCMLVGSDGTARRTAHGLRYLSRANAYRWNGSALRRLAVPAPPHARQADLSGVSCPAATSCMAVGNYISAAGRSLPYSALWTSGSWRVQAARTIGGKTSTIFQAVSCAAAASCVAVGDAVKPGFTALAEQYAGGTWTTRHVAFKPRSAFYSVSCPGPAYCVAVGVHGTRSLIEAWNGARWSAQSVPVTAAPLTTDALLHVSCMTGAICAAVGYRHDPKSRYSYHTLAAYWNGSSWTIRKSANQVG